MGRYIDWDDVVDRYPQAETMGDATDVGSVYIAYSEAYVDGRLANAFTVPFSSSNAMLRDLCVDIAYARMGLMTDAEEATMISSMANVRLSDLINGTLKMVDDTGTVIPQTTPAAFTWSSTQSYANTFNMLDPELQEVSELRLSDDYNSVD